MTFTEWWQVAGNKDWDLVIGAFRDCWNMAAAEEREACAQIADAHLEDADTGPAADAIQAAIRRRGR